jgi:acetoin utilization protein AcuC
MSQKLCKVGVAFGPESSLYSFPGGHPMNNSRTELFAEAMKRLEKQGNEPGAPGNVSVVAPVQASEGDLLMFHTKEYVDFVRMSSKVGEGVLDYGDTPSYKGVYEASLYTVGSTLNGIDLIMKGQFDHFFNPVGGLHHARSDRAGGFCVFNDAAIAICELLEKRKMKRVAYVDIDAHHGDGVYYGFESDPRVIIGDIHEDGRYLYPGTGDSSETGTKGAEGTKLNIPMHPRASDSEFFEAFDRVEEFVRGTKPEFILLQCGADCLSGDPITHLSYTAEVHAYATRKLHKVAHDLCKGRILAMGGGGYDPMNVAEGWTAVVGELSGVKVRGTDPKSLGPWW